MKSQAADDLALFGMDATQIERRGFETQPVKPARQVIEVLACNMPAFEVWRRCQQTVQYRTVTVDKPFGGSVTRSMAIYSGLSAQEIHAAMMGVGLSGNAALFSDVHELGAIVANRRNEEEARNS